jgi:tetratricopeptide (TPR) repeat protein
MANVSDAVELCQQAWKLLKSGQRREARTLFEQVRQADDSNTDAHDGLATSFLLDGNFANAIVHLERMTRLDPRRASCWINLGAAYNRTKNYQKAAEVLRRAVQIDRKSSAAYFNLGFAHKHLKQWAMAVPAYREAIRLDPLMADAYLNLGNVYLEMGNITQSLAQFRKALEIQPGMKRAQQGLEKAQARADAAKGATSPFGRLVDPKESIAAQGVPPLTSHEPTEEERTKDRQTVFDAVTSIETDAREVIGCLKERIDSAVRTLNRLLTHRPSPHGEHLSKTEAFEQFEEACQAFEPRCDQLKASVQRLRDHEGTMK